MIQSGKKTMRTCTNGHQYLKSSDCPTCPKCESQKDHSVDFISLLSNPAKRALQHHHINSIENLAQHTQKQILALHGIGPASLPHLNDALKQHGLTFKEE